MTSATRLLVFILIAIGLAISLTSCSIRGDDDSSSSENGTPTATAAQSDQNDSNTVGDGSGNDDPRTGYFDSSWPYARADGWRTGTAVGAGLPDDVQSSSLIAQSVELPPVPTWGVTYSDNAMFVLGGSPFLLEQFSVATSDDAGSPLSGSEAQGDLDLSSIVSTLAGAVEQYLTVQPYIAKIDPQTMTVTDITEFPRGTTVNYTGDLLLHENGNLYAVTLATIYEVDPNSMEITGSLELPKYDTLTAATAYNGLLVLPQSGDLVTKGINQFDSSLPAKLIAVNPDDLSIRFQTEASISATRVTIVSQDDTDYVYASSNTETQRFTVEDDGFQVDQSWSETYRTADDGTQAAVAMTYMGDQKFVIFPNNNTVIFGVTQPLQLFTQSTDTTDPSLESMNATSATSPGGSFYSVAADPFNSRIIVENDQINGIMAGWRREDDGSFTKVWESDNYQSVAGAAIASDQEHLYIEDRRQCDDSEMNCEIFLVVLDLTTGDQLAEIKVTGTMPSLGQIVLAKDSVFYIASQAGEDTGFITKVSLE